MNIALSIIKLFPNARPDNDFVVQDDSDGNGPYLKAWSLPDPQPTVQELQAAWDIIKDRPPAKSPEQKTIDDLTAAKEQLNLSIIEIWENIIPLLP